MSTIDRIISVMKEKGIKQKELCDYLGKGEMVFSNWKAGRSESYKKYLPQIAEFFGCSVDYLLGKEQKKEAVQTNGQEEDIDNEIMRLVEGMSLAQKQMVLLETYRLLQRQQKEEDASKNH